MWLLVWILDGVAIAVLADRYARARQSAAPASPRRVTPATDARAILPGR